MRTSIYRALGILFLLAAIAYQSKAQLSLSINIGTQPTWGPEGYDRADYYYLPDVESYYSVSSHQFIYLSNGRWIYSSALPARYSNYDLYSGYKVVVNRPRPYLNYTQDRVQYARYKNYHSKQVVIRDSRDVRYKQRGGNPHGMPPGQAKKYDDHDRGGRDHRGNDNGHGDHGNKHDNNGNDHGHGHGHN